MPVKKIFTDDKDNELEAYVNEKGKLFISVGQNDEDHSPYSGWITLDRSDLDELIDLLTELRDQVFDDSDFEDESAQAAANT